MTPLATIIQNGPRTTVVDHARRTRRAPNPQQHVGGAQPGFPYPKRRLRLASAAATSPVRSAINPVGGEAPDHPRQFTPLIDAKAASGLLGVPYTWLLAQAREGRIPHHRLGHYVRFNPEDLRDWLQETKLTPTANGFHRR
jgi:excisionase family DNA binding protein